MSAYIVIKILKIAHSNIFKKKRERLKVFLLQIKIKIRFNETQFKSKVDKILYTATYLKNNIIK